MPKGVYVHAESWTAAQIAIVRANAGKISAKRIAALVHTFEYRVHNLIGGLGLRAYHCWTKAALADLRANGSTMTNVEFSAKHGITIEGVCKKARQFGVTLIHREWPGQWPSESIERMRQIAPDCTGSEAAAVLGRTVTATKWKARQLGIMFRSERIILRSCPWCAEKFKTKALEYHKPRCEKKPPRVKKAAPKPRTRRVAKPKPRKFVQAVAVSRIAYCPSCRAPVSNQEAHYERMPQCKRQPAITQGVHACRQVSSPAHLAG